MGYLEETKGYTVIKVGKTTKNCWSRCKNEDYLIHQAVRLCYYPDSNNKVPNGLCDFLEAAMIFEYRNRYTTFKGDEYFYIPDKSIAEIEAEWRNILKSIIKNYAPTVNEKAWFWLKGPVGPYTY
jgi:hypothetical protein